MYYSFGDYSDHQRLACTPGEPFKLLAQGVSRGSPTSLAITIGWSPIKNSRAAVARPVSWERR